MTTYIALALAVSEVAGFAWMMREVRWNWTRWNVIYSLMWPLWALMLLILFFGLTLSEWIGDR